MRAGRLIGRFADCERGNFAIIAAVVALPLVAASGVAIDYSRLSAAESKLQAAVDSAVLAAAASGEPVHIMQQIVEGFVEANYTDYPVAVETTVETHRIRVEAHALVPLPVLAAAGYDSQRVEVEAAVDSARPLKGGAVAASDGGPAPAALPSGAQREIADIRKKYRAALRKLPARERARLEKQLERYLFELEQQASAGIRLSD